MVSSRLLVVSVFATSGSQSSGSFRPGSPRASGPSSKLSAPSPPKRLGPNSETPRKLPSSLSTGSIFWATQPPPAVPELPLGWLHLLGNPASSESSQAPPRPAPSSGQPGLLQSLPGPSPVLRKLPSSPSAGSIFWATRPPSEAPEVSLGRLPCFQSFPTTLLPTMVASSALALLQAKREPDLFPSDDLFPSASALGLFPSTSVLGLFPLATRSP